MTTSFIQPSLSKGEIGPELAARADLQAYHSALAKCENYVISPFGGALNRPGTRFLGQTPDNEVARLIRFKFNAYDTYALEFTHLKMRLYRNGAIVMDGASPYELETPYTRDQLFDLVYTQSADIMDIVHPDHRPMKLKRYGHTNWTIDPVVLVPAIPAPASATATVASGGSSTVTQDWRYQVTAVKDDGVQVIEESLPVTSNTITLKNDNLKATVTWGAVAGASYYNVYKDNAGAGIYGFIGKATTLSFVDNNIGPTKTDTPPTGEDPFVGEGNYPSAVGYFQQRLVYGATDNKPQTLWFSRIGITSNFGYSTPTKDDDAITWTMASGEVNRIKHLLSLRQLVTFTDGAEWMIQGQTGVFTAKTINGEAQTYNGSGQLRPLVINSTALYAQEQGRTVSAFGYSLQQDGFSGEDIGVMSPQMLSEYGLVDWDYQKSPYSIVWGVREDGAMVGITYMQEQQVTAWHRHVTDGKVLSVCCVPEGREDAVYLCVERMVQGQAKRYIERMESRQLPKHNGETYVDACWFVDCGLSFVGLNFGSTTVTLSGQGWRYPDEITATASDGIFTANDVGNYFQVIVSAAERLRFEVKAVLSETQAVLVPMGPVPDEYRNKPFTNWAQCRRRLTGMDHLEGRDIVVLADGNVINGLKVTGGAIDLPDSHSLVIAGLPYESEIVTLDIELQQAETTQDKRKRLTQVTAVLLDTRGGWYGPHNWRTKPGSLYEFKPRLDSDSYGAIQPMTGKATQSISTSWSDSAQVAIVQRDPLPIHVLALVPRLEIGGPRS